VALKARSQSGRELLFTITETLPLHYIIAMITSVLASVRACFTRFLTVSSLQILVVSLQSYNYLDPSGPHLSGY
jgi:hypothetical protein